MSQDYEADPNAKNGGRDNSLYLTVVEGARLCRSSPWWLRKRVGQPGGPPWVRRGKKYLLPRKEFERWIEQQVIR